MNYHGLRFLTYPNRKEIYGVYKRLTPANQSYDVNINIVDYIFIINDSTLTITNPESNITISRQNNLVDVSSFRNTKCILQSGNTDVESLSLFSLKSLSNPIVFQNVELVDIQTSYDLPAGKVALVAEGTLSVPFWETNVSANSEVDMYSVGPRFTNTTLTGTGKLIIFDVQ